MKTPETGDSTFRSTSTADTLLDERRALRHPKDRERPRSERKHDDPAAARAGDRDRLVEDIRAVAEAAHENGAAGEGGALLKVIVETALLDDDAIVLACEAAVEAGADFVKTSTGFSTAGATAEHVALMRRTVGEHVGVKASGGVRTREDALAMIEAGATRIGASSALAILGTD